MIEKPVSEALRDIRSNYKRLSEETKMKTPPDYPHELQIIGCNEIADACYDKLEDAEKCFSDKASTGGEMPVGDWVQLPPLNSF